MTNPDLLKAILAMDSYNRGPSRGLATGSEKGASKIGQAVFQNDKPEDSGFLAAYYKLGDTTIISYRGTDTYSFSSLLLDAAAWGGGGGWETAQAKQAAQFYKGVVGAANLYDAKVEFVGHSLGGGLAGLMASLYGQRATVFDNMAFELTAASVYNNATNPMTFTEHGLIPNTYHQPTLDTYYGELAPRPPTGAGVEGFEVDGQALEGWQSVGKSLYPGSGFDGLSLGPVDRHSMSLLVVLLYAQQNYSSENAGWFWLREPLLNALFDNAIGAAAGFGAIDGNSGDADKMRTAIAYSAIGGTEGLVFGNNAIEALFRDATKLGSMARAGDNLQSLSASLGERGQEISAALSSILVQYAGQLAALRDTNVVNAEGMTRVTQDYAALGVDGDASIWGGGSSVIVGKEALDEVLLSMSGALPETGKASVERTLDEAKFVVVANASGGLVEGSDVEKLFSGSRLISQASTPDDKDPGVIVLGGAGDDSIIGGNGADFLVGGEGSDRIDGGSLETLVPGGTDVDFLFGNEGDDILIGGTGVNVLNGGAGNDVFAVGQGIDIIRGAVANVVGI